MAAASAGPVMIKLPTETLRGARVRAPRGFALQAQPVGLGGTIPPGHQVFAIDGHWPRRHLLTPDAVALVTSLEKPRTLGRGTIPNMR